MASIKQKAIGESNPRYLRYFYEALVSSISIFFGEHNDTSHPYTGRRFGRRYVI
jgi:hypothetical protein